MCGIYDEQINALRILLEDGWDRKCFAGLGVNGTLIIKQIISIGGFKVLKWIQPMSFSRHVLISSPTSFA